MAAQIRPSLLRKNSQRGEPLKINVYDLTQVNGYMYWCGLGVYHSAIEAFGTEYAYGAHDFPTSGVFEVEPRQCPGFRFRKTLIVGTIWMGPEKFREFIEEIACEYTGDSYHLLFKNCNHFCDDVCKRLVNLPLPGWINRLARIGSICSCLLPDTIPSEDLNSIEYQTCIENDRNRLKDKKKKSYRRLAGSLSMVVPKRKHLVASSSSSAYLRSSLKDLNISNLSKSISRQKNDNRERTALTNDKENKP